MKRILIVEDEKPLREAFCFLLKSEHFIVETAENGKVGLQKLPTFRPNLILLDMLMPLVNGITFLQRAHLSTDYPDTKTIMLSNLSDAITFDDAAVYGVTMSILKADLSPAELVDTIKKVLSDSQ